MPQSRRRRPPPTRGPRPPRPPAPRVSFGTHFRSALRELFTQRAAGWRMAALVVIIGAGLFGGQAIADAAGISGAWATTAVQLGVVLVVTAALALVVAAGRWRNAR